MDHTGSKSLFQLVLRTLGSEIISECGLGHCIKAVSAIAQFLDRLKRTPAEKAQRTRRQSSSELIREPLKGETRGDRRDRGGQKGVRPLSLMAYYLLLLVDIVRLCLEVPVLIWQGTKSQAALG